jgi:hypothetical protein
VGGEGLVSRIPRAIALLTLLAGVVVSPLTAAESTDGVAEPVQPQGITCNTAPADKIGECVTRMLTDPHGSYSPFHVQTAAEKVPVRPADDDSTQDDGSWSVVANCTVNRYKVNPIHASVLRTGKVLMTAGSGFNQTNFTRKIFKAWLWNPATPGTCPKEIPMPRKDLFCSGHSQLSDGRVLFFGGNARYGVEKGPYYGGLRESYSFDPATERFTYTGPMSAARWYPNGPVNTAGNPVVVGGLDRSSKSVAVNEMFSASTRKWRKLPGRRAFPLYAGMMLRKNGQLCYTGTYFAGRAGVSPQCWSWTKNRSQPIGGLPYPDCRDQANSLLLFPAQAQKVMVVGGGCARGVTSTSATVNLNAARPRFVPGPTLDFAAMHSCATVLPDGSAFVAGGGDHNRNPRLAAARLPAGATEWETDASPAVGRMYHSTCLLLTSGAVITLGTNAGVGQVETRFELYRPWYMESDIERPRITGVLRTLRLGGTYQATYQGSRAVTGATLSRLPAVTHSTDPNQRVVQVGVTRAATGRVNLKLDRNPGILPPGYYMLSLKDSSGTPSASVVVRVVPKATARTTAATAGSGSHSVGAFTAVWPSRVGPNEACCNSNAACCNCPSGVCTSAGPP